MVADCKLRRPGYLGFWVVYIICLPLSPGFILSVLGSGMLMGV